MDPVYGGNLYEKPRAIKLKRPKKASSNDIALGRIQDENGN
jgi:hypothetical protein